jgi:TolB protein
VGARLRGTLIGACLVALVLAAPAQAAFPGQNGKIAYAASISGNVDIYVTNPDGTGQARLTTDPAWDSQPAWSPDGREIAFTSMRDNPDPATCNPCNTEIYVMNADGTNVRRVTNSSTPDFNPSWSPDGTRLVLTRLTLNIKGEIWTVAPDGSNLSLVTAEDPSGSCADRADQAVWSPEGSYIATLFYSPDYQLCPLDGIISIVHPDGTGGQGVTGGIALNIDWSPDATRLAWADNERAFIYRLSDHTRTSIGECCTDQLAWSPDGTKLVLRSGEMVTVNLDGTGVQNVPAPTGDYGAGYGVDWQPILKGYPRPKAATPLYISLVPAYQQCSAGSATKTHAPPLADASCTAAQTSDQLTVGSFDANGNAANGTGYIRAVRLGDLTTPADDSDVRLVSQITDVRNKVGLGDYTGELRAELSLRITDKENTPYPGGPGPGTVVDTTFAFTIPCATTPDTIIGSQCSIDTTADTLAPGIAPENGRAIWATDQVKVYDGGPDGNADTAPNTLFEAQGVFAP